MRAFVKLFAFIFSFNLSAKTVENQYLVRLKDGIQSTFFSLNNKIEIHKIRGPQNLFRLKLKTGVDIKQVARSFQDKITYIEPVYEISLPSFSKEPLFLQDIDFSEQWGMENANDTDININEAWDFEKGSRNVIVAVIDSGTLLTHPEFDGQIWVNNLEIPNNNIDDDENGYIDDVNGWDFQSQDNDPTDDNSHGSHITGIIAARGLRVYGVAPGVSILPLRFLNKFGVGDTGMAIEAIEYAIKMGAKIINASWGSHEHSEELRLAIERATTNGIIFIAAAGNDGEDLSTNPMYPASYKLPGLIAVANMTQNGNLHNSSSYGSEYVLLSAPGTRILSAYLRNGYASYTGTSMAAPFVTGAVALLKSYNPYLTAAEIVSILEKTTKSYDSQKNKLKSGGGLDIGKALKQIANGYSYFKK